MASGIDPAPRTTIPPVRMVAEEAPETGAERRVVGQLAVDDDRVRPGGGEPRRVPDGERAPDRVEVRFERPCRHAPPRARE